MIFEKKKKLKIIKTKHFLNKNKYKYIRNVSGTILKFFTCYQRIYKRKLFYINFFYTTF